MSTPQRTPQSKSELANYYQVSAKTMGEWLRRVYLSYPTEFENCLHKQLFTPRQISLILEHLGEPKDRKHE